MPDQRRSPRIRTRFESLVSAQREEGVGLLADIAYEGAHVEEASFQPAIGAAVRIYVFIRPVAPFEITGHVVRHTERGFAIEFEKLRPEVRSLVDDAAALVTVPAGPKEESGSDPTG